MDFFDIQDMFSALQGTNQNKKQLIQVLEHSNAVFSQKIIDQVMKDWGNFAPFGIDNFGQDINIKFGDQPKFTNHAGKPQDIDDNEYTNEKDGSKKWKRKNNQNACKKVNTYAFKCLQSLNQSEKFNILKKVIYRYDIFLVVLLIVKHLGQLEKFVQIYGECNDMAIKYQNKFYKDLVCPDVCSFYQKTKISMNKFMEGNIEEAVSALYDTDNLKCKLYLIEAKNRYITLFQESPDCLQHNYMEKRNKKKNSGAI